MKNPQDFESVAAAVFLLDHFSETLPVFCDRTDMDLSGIQFGAVRRMLEKEFLSGLGTFLREPLVTAVLSFRG